MLESKHVIGLFFLMLLFSGVFFSLGYVMGRNQYDGQVRAAGNARTTTDVPPAHGSRTAANHAEDSRSTDPAVQPAGDWGDFYDAGNSKPVDDHLKPAHSVFTAARTPAAKPSRSSASAAPASSGSYTLQVAALKHQADAMALARSLQKKKFPAFVLSPRGDKYFRVQVGPYADQKGADAAKNGLEGAGFKAIVKH